LLANFAALDEGNDQAVAVTIPVNLINLPAKPVNPVCLNSLFWLLDGMWLDVQILVPQ
jgi:hypothetical protein